MLLSNGRLQCLLNATSAKCCCKYLTATLAASATISFALPLAFRESSLLPQLVRRSFTTLSTTSSSSLNSSRRTLVTDPSSDSHSFIRPYRYMFRNEHQQLRSQTQQSKHYLTMSGGEDAHGYSIEEKGSLYTTDYRVYFKGPKGYISPWHDVPLYADEAKKIYNMIVEIPRWTNAKMEMATKEAMSPIKQDIKKGAVRFVDNVFPHHGYIWNYGALPQTWEDPGHVDKETKAKGDNDPIDVIEIGSKIHKRGDIVKVKVVGTIALIDEGETDWKLVAIDVSDPVAAEINSTEDVEKHFPGLLRATHEWFRTYKIPAGKPANQFGFGGQYKNAEFAEKIIVETHEFWKKLIKEASPQLNTETNVEGSAHMASQEAWKKIVESQPAVGKANDIPASLDRWHFIQG